VLPGEPKGFRDASETKIKAEHIFQMCNWINQNNNFIKQTNTATTRVVLSVSVLLVHTKCTVTHILADRLKYFAYFQAIHES
jgi:hypothetical protein